MSPHLLIVYPSVTQLFPLVVPSIAWHLLRKRSQLSQASSPTTVNISAAIRATLCSTYLSETLAYALLAIYMNVNGLV